MSLKYLQLLIVILGSSQFHNKVIRFTPVVHLMDEDYFGDHMELTSYKSLQFLSRTCCNGVMNKKPA